MLVSPKILLIPYYRLIRLPLEAYKLKRDFGITPEPDAILKDSGKDLIYVIQKHQARNLHWDLRLERDGVLKSWAVPKEPPLQPEIKRLAVAVEDHPVEYANFEGDIPEGEYGAGTVEIWDKGTYVPVKWKEKEIIVDIHGERLKGKYVLIKTKFKGNKNSWLFFKKKA
jgi:DNA ligase D-like protein (predicted 3'-phosphoesterase)